MRLRIRRLLHALASAPVATVLTVATAPVVHAQTSVPTTRPAPIVVAIDPGHGGSPDDNRPDQPFDPGVIGVNGALEKDLTLQVATRIRTLLERDRVAVAMTRTTDRYVDIPSRMDVAVAAHAAAFVSIHFNSYTDPSIGGSLTLYPNQASQPFATTMSQSLGSELGPVGIPSDGIQLKDDLWVHATMPAVTVEGGFLTNPHEAGLLATAGMQDRLAGAVRDAIETQLPEIIQRRDQIAAWDAAHPDTANPSSRSGPIPAAAGGGVRVVALIAALALLARFRVAVGLGLAMAVRAVVVGVGVAQGRHTARRRRQQARQRRREARERALARKDDRARSRGVYDELTL